MQWLLQHGADANAQAQIGTTPLMAAASLPSANVTRLLLSHGANPNAQDLYGRTALYWAMIMPKETGVVSELLAHGADPNLPDQSGKTPLQRAQGLGLTAVVRLFKSKTK